MTTDLRNKKKINIADFRSRWEYTKATSSWHFDTKINEDAQPPFKRLAVFQADFSQIIDYALNNNSPTTLFNRLRNGKEPFTAELERFDLKNMGVPENHVLFNETREDQYGGQWPIEIRKMVHVLGIQQRGLGIAIHVQYPGQVFPLHIDAFPYMKENQEHHILDEYPDAAARFTVQLKNWEWGHMWMYGNTCWKQWVAGELTFHSWRDLPHCTANGGFTPRVSLQISGLVTEKTKRLFAQAEAAKTLNCIDLAAVSLS